MRKIGLPLLAVLFVAAGVMHLISPKPFVQIVPPQIPRADWVVAISGIAEILGGIGIAVPAARRAARWGLVALLVCVFPANIYMAKQRISPDGITIPAALLWSRLPLQPLLIWWVLAATRRKNAEFSSE